MWGEFEVDCRTNRVTGERPLVGELTRGWVRAAPGRLTSTTYDPKARLLRASGTASRGDGDLVAFFPGVPKVKASGLRSALVQKGPGWAIVTATPGGGPWSLRLAPA